MSLNDRILLWTKIPVTIKNGRIWLSFRAKEIDITDGAQGELSISPDAIKNSSLREFVKKTEKVILLSSASVLHVELRVENADQKNDIIDRLSGYNNTIFRQVKLLEPLFIEYKGFKSARLFNCHCVLIDENLEAKSLNHAYTILSEKYETHRTSHTGNVFEKVYYITDEYQKLSLKKLRDDGLEKLISQRLKDLIE